MNLNQTTFLRNFEDYLKLVFETITDSPVKEAMIYALQAQGKRFRPLLVHSIANTHSNDQDLMVLASAIEMIHTYSLIHDDLPAMDNDDLRRGQATVHKKFDEATAILAGDALLTFAFEWIASSALQPEVKVKALNIMAVASGANGMIYGQSLDMNPIEIEDEKSLIRCYEHKTGALFSAALQLGNCLRQRELDNEVLLRIGKQMGIVFQIQDDYLEAITATDVLGKSNHSDIDNNKQTFVKLIGVEPTRQTIIQLYENLNRAIIDLPISSSDLSDLVAKMAERMY